MNRRWICGLLIVISLGMIASYSPPTAAAVPPISVRAQGAALIDVTSGRVLYSKNGDEPMRIASLTKVMTAIIAIENGNLSDEVKISRRAAGKEGSSLYLKVGETMSLHHLLYGLMLRSGNDAATAIAEHVGGSVEGFVYLMNEKARWLGMDHTTFSNPSGLDEAGGNFASAIDMAKLMAYALHNQVFQEIGKTKVKRVPNPNGTGNYVWANKNKMLSIYPGADGGKTGYTKLAKRCLISSATRDGQQLAVVTLNDPDDWIDHAKLFNYGFEHYPLSVLAEQGEQVGEQGWLAERTFAYPLTAEEQGQVERKTVPYSQRSADYKLGIAGLLQFSVGGEQVGAVRLLGGQTMQTEARTQTWSARLAEAWHTALRSIITVY